MLVDEKGRKKSLKDLSVEVNFKIFEFFFILDQSQVCISNGLGARALQREALIYENAFLYRDCKTEMGNVFTQTDAISKQKKIAMPDWRQMKKTFKGFSKGFQMVLDFS